ncbi:response regulator transcription factor [Arenibacterium halophilum]|uniref:Response regulator transcription factor n=1 Tax=Arenibacterium halophilum TaxID=2583821 RepID=A0ABY2XD54_9RHOB|nr:response regulator [Arenibacterium halophilum]TMV14949.1 response regulator transcription factor [Arenibacterium halophilum]
MNPPVYLVDDDVAVRDALSLLLSTVGVNVRAFSGPQDFLSVLPKLVPGCLILDIRMPAISGLKLQEQLTASGVSWPTVVISGHGDMEACRKAFRNGAIDFLSKPIDEQDLIDAIQKGLATLGRAAEADAERRETMALMACLTPREREVLSFVARGFTTRDIAGSLKLSPRTVESHRAAIGAKLGTTSAAEMTRLWIEAGSAP